MPKPPPPPNSAPWYVSRAALLIAAAIIFSLAFVLFAGPSWSMAVYRLVWDGAALLIWLIAAAGLGYPLWRILDPREPASAAVPLITAIALGLGVMSLLTFAAALVHCLNIGFAVVVLGVGALIALAWVVQRRDDLPASQWLLQPAGLGWLWLLAMPLLAEAAIGACFPPGILWGDEPNGYDVVEYHLQVPREWYQLGQMTPLHHNVFSYMPFNVEMHYLLAMCLRGGPWAGMYLAQAMHLAMMVLLVLAVYAVAGGGRAGTLAALLTAAVPWTTLLAPIAYNEGGELLFATLAIGWAALAHGWRAFLLAGVFAGLSAGCKLSILPLLLLGLPLAALASHRGPGLLRLVRDLALYILLALLLLSPWLIRTAFWTGGNPVFPEAMSILGKAHFTQVQMIRWQRAYLPDPHYRGGLRPLLGLWQQVVADWRYGYALVPLGLAAAALRLRKSSGQARDAIYLVVLCLFQTLFWLLFTHLQSRFMTIAIPLLAWLVVLTHGRRWTQAVAALAAAMLVFSSIAVGIKLSRFLGFDRAEMAQDHFSILGHESLFFLRDTHDLPRTQPIDLVGDASAFWYQIPTDRLHYKTIFDVDTSDPSKTIIQDWLAGMPQPPHAFVYLDGWCIDELRRFSRTYYDVPPPPRHVTLDVPPS